MRQETVSKILLLSSDLTIHYNLRIKGTLQAYYGRLCLQLYQITFKLPLNAIINWKKFLSKNPHLSDSYFNVFANYESQSKIEEVPESEIINYMPHHPVLKPSSESSPIRPVFDASAKSFDDKSLNDYLEPGPPLHTKIFSILLRVGRWLILLGGILRLLFMLLY